MAENNISVETLPFAKTSNINSSEFTKTFEDPKFKDWFKDSAFKKEEGTPILFFTGGASNIQVFNRDNPQNTGENQYGYYFSPDIRQARFYAQKYASNQAEEGQESKGSIYTVCLKSEQPLIVDKNSPINPTSLDQWPDSCDSLISQKNGASILEVTVKNPDQIWILKEEDAYNKS
jgi:hypothetical protein